MKSEDMGEEEQKPHNLPKLNEKEQQLFDLIQNGEEQASLELLNDPEIAVNCFDKHGTSLLQQACFKGLIPVVEELLKRGADVNANQHEHGYTALMFAALSGNPELCRILLEAGAKTHKTNRVDRTASQMAAFTGQYQCVSVINNFLSQDDIEYWNFPPGATAPRISPSLVPPLHILSRTYNVRPVETVLFLAEHLDFLKEQKQLLSFVEDLVDVQMKQKDTNEIMALKLHIIHRTMKSAFKFVIKSKQEENTPETSEKDLLMKFVKYLLTTDRVTNYPKNTELLLRQAVKEFPHHHCMLFQTLVKALAKTELGREPSAVSCIHQTLLGQRVMMDDVFCGTCGEGGAMKRCSACKTVNYCSAECQKLHWTSHKPWCSKKE